MNIGDLSRALREAEASHLITLEVLSELRPGQMSLAELKAGTLAWLDEYDTPGYYNRQHTGYDARFCYQHLQNAVALLWIAETAGVESHILRQGAEAILSTSGRPGTVAAAFRRACSWETVEQQLVRRT
ncbi:hypothetical protein [Deinococcus navajonensis]|uniref:Uncharacterized protein n=1 Tax=Deinococcus navajonensis TaxID=309884 RepID=A0ABV8XNS6_9DEIO